MRLSTAICYVVSAALLIFILTPIVLMVVGGLTPEVELKSSASSPIFLHGPTLIYYEYLFLSPFGYTLTQLAGVNPYVVPDATAITQTLSVLNASYFLGILSNSVLVATTVAITNLLFASLAAFSFTRITYRGRTAAFVFILLSRLLPPAVLAIPYYVLIQSFGLLNNLASAVLIYTVLTLPFSIWYLTLYFRTIPVEIEEASLVDGATLWQTLRNVTIRISGSGLVAITLFSFILSYNEFLFAHFLLQRTDLQTVPVYVGYLSTSLVVYWSVIHAVLALTIVPMVVLILVFRKFVNITQLAGALKGS